MNTNRFEHPRSIGTKLLLSHLTLCVVIIVLTGLMSYAITSQFIRDTRVDDLLNKADKIAESSYLALGGEFRPGQRTVRIYESLTDAKVFFLDADSGTIRLSSYHREPDEHGSVPPMQDGTWKDETATQQDNEETASAPLEDPEDDGNLQWMVLPDSIDREFAQRILDGERITAVRRFEFAQEEILFAGVPILDDEGEVRGGVILSQPVAKLYNLSRMVRYMLVFIMSVSLLLSVVLSMNMSRLLVRPIRRITRAARRMEDGVYAERITDLPQDEIGELGHALNSMSGRLVEVINNLREERDKLELVMSGIGEGLIAVDIEGRVIHVNDAFLEIAELESISRLSSPDEKMAPLRPLNAMLKRCMDTGAPQTLTWENASHRAIYAQATVYRDEAGNISGAVCLMRDVSEAQRMEQLRRDYVANISHELRTPLTGIRGMVEPLIDGCMDTEEERLNSYKIILKETIRLQKLVGEMLDMSRLQDGRLKVDLEFLELPGILEAAVRSMEHIADECGVALSVETDGSSLACMGNEDRIMQVLVILIDNALSFTPRGGSVVVFGRDDGDYVSVGVRDTGCGIEPKDLPLIWERFYKADKSRMRTTGTGLGLSIAKLVTQLMGGDIRVKSEPGAGSEFTFTLLKR